jgi:hypothetical protein
MKAFKGKEGRGSVSELLKFYGLPQGRKMREGQRDLPASSVFSIAKLPYFGALCSEQHRLIFEKWPSCKNQCVLLDNFFQCG